MLAVADVSGMPVVKVVGPLYGVLTLPRLTLEELRWRRDAVGWVGPVRAPVWAAVGSVASRRTPDALDEAVDATEAEWARRALSSLVKRLT